MNTDVRLTVYMRSQASAGALQSERAEVAPQPVTDVSLWSSRHRKPANP
jgi:hypothetical protein